MGQLGPTPQLESPCAAVKVPCATDKTRCSQTNRMFFKREKWGRGHRACPLPSSSPPQSSCHFPGRCHSWAGPELHQVQACLISSSLTHFPCPALPSVRCPSILLLHLATLLYDSWNGSIVQCLQRCLSHSDSFIPSKPHFSHYNLIDVPWIVRKRLLTTSCVHSSCVQMPRDTETNQTLCAIGGEGERNAGANSQRWLLVKTRTSYSEDTRGEGAAWSWKVCKCGPRDRRRGS